MNAAVIARIAKFVALFGFVLPWVLVSCANQPLVSLTGIDLVMGTVNLHNPVTGAAQHQPGHPNIWIAASLALIILGLVASFILRGRTAVLAMAGAALAAFVLSAFGVSRIGADAHAAAQSPQPGAQFDPSMANAIQVHAQYGYWLTSIALLVCLGACALILTGRSSGVEGRSTGPP
jgi:hypothetical protein